MRGRWVSGSECINGHCGSPTEAWQTLMRWMNNGGDWGIDEGLEESPVE